MSITGCLSDFSLREIFQFIEKGQRTGLLTLSAALESPATAPSMYYIWLSKGSIVAAANQLNQQGLIWLIDQYPWVSNRVVTKLAQFCPPDKALGLYLRSQGALQTEQLEHLFQIQLARQVCPLFQLKEAQFKFEQNVSLPGQEMTGLSLPSEFIEIMLQKVVWLKKLFESRNQQRQTSGFSSNSNTFCNQLCEILDIAFFHSLKFSLFDLDHSIPKLSQIFDLYEHPYDLPKSITAKAMCYAGN